LTVRALEALRTVLLLGEDNWEGPRTACAQVLDDSIVEHLLGLLVNHCVFRRVQFEEDRELFAALHHAFLYSSSILIGIRLMIMAM